MKDNRTNENNLRSAKARELLGEIPPALVFWASVIVLGIFIALIIAICFLDYPYSENESILLHLLR